MREAGLQVAAHLYGELIVDAWAGSADPKDERPVDRDTLFPVFSVTKAVTATALHIQAERGFVEYNAPVARYWPEFAQNGKVETTVRDVLSHRAGIPAMPVGVTAELMCDWDWMIHAIEKFRPIYRPGTTNAYHRLVFGWIVGEIVRRTDPAHRTFGQFVHDEICKPLGIERGFYIGLPASEIGRVAVLMSDISPEPDPDPLREMAMPTAVFAGPPVHNRPDVWQAIDPGAGALMNAASCSRFFAMLANGGELGGIRLLSKERIRTFTQPRQDPYTIDQMPGRVVWISNSGYFLGGGPEGSDPVIGPSPHAICGIGMGGTIGYADIESGLSFAICHNRMHPWHQVIENPFIEIANAIRAMAR
jgi:CubicO group peptidase (beta-lactamase class C family)